MKGNNINFETIKSNKNRLYLLGGFVCVVVLMVTIFIGMSESKYRNTQSIPLINGTITFNNADLNVIAMYQMNDAGTYEEIEVMPSSGYVISEEKSYCNVNGEKDNNAILKTINGNHTFANLQKGSKCYIYFNKTVASIILANKTIQERSSFASPLTTNTNGTIYQAEDEYGTSYYFAGNTTENWLSFAGFYWRIIRINGDGTLRIIYNGTSTSTTGSGTQLPSGSQFNSTMAGNNRYVGYMYGANSNTYEGTHANNNNSTIKGVVDTWYQNNIASHSEYTSKISATTGFCGDRSPSTSSSASNGDGGYSTATTYYGAYIRLVTNKTPTYECSNTNDLYTVSGTGVGNEALTYPVGLITADEVAYAGGVYRSSNTSYYLYTRQSYWTISPHYYANSAYVFAAYSDGSLYVYYNTNNSYAIRPVINLKADVTLTGDGTADQPFVVS